MKLRVRDKVRTANVTRHIDSNHCLRLRSVPAAIRSKQITNDVNDDGEITDPEREELPVELSLMRSRHRTKR